MSSSDGSPLTLKDGQRVDWKSVLTVSMGVISTSLFGGMADAISAFLTALWVSPLRTLSNLVTGVINVVTFPLDRTAAASWAAATEFVRGLGPFAFLGAVGIVVVTAFVVAEVFQS